MPNKHLNYVFLKMSVMQLERCNVKVLPTTSVKCGGGSIILWECYFLLATGKLQKTQDWIEGTPERLDYNTFLIEWSSQSLALNVNKTLCLSYFSRYAGGDVP